MLKLYDYYRSSASFRVRIALNLKGLDYQVIPIHLLNQGGEQFSSDYQKINPQSLVPALADGKLVITQSLAIIEYLNECYPIHPLLPEKAYDRALVRAFSLMIAADIHPINNLRVLKYLSSEFKISEEQKTHWIRHWIDKGLAALESQLTKHTHTTTFSFGDQPTVADICLVPQLYNARRFDCDLSHYPTLVRVDAACQQHSAFTNAWPMETVT
jgi:maleylacetoacetate isomerase